MVIAFIEPDTLKVTVVMLGNLTSLAHTSCVDLDELASEFWDGSEDANAMLMLHPISKSPGKKKG